MFVAFGFGVVVVVCGLMVVLTVLVVLLLRVVWVQWDIEVHSWVFDVGDVVLWFGRCSGNDGVDEGGGKHVAKLCVVLFGWCAVVVVVDDGGDQWCVFGGAAGVFVCSGIVCAGSVVG